jgi:hypothetical protein
MTASDVDYDIDIRSVDPSYSHTLARTAGRDVDDGEEVHLTSLSVTIRVQQPTGERESSTFAATFRVDHEAEQLTWKTLGDEFDNSTSFRVSRLVTAMAAAVEAAMAFCDDVGLEYALERAQVGQVCAPTVHTALEVVDR